MGVEELKMMKTQLVGCIQGQLGNLQGVDTHELGEAIDMVKDLSEAIYYCTITEAMEKKDDEKGESTSIVNYYTSKMYPDYREMERNNGYMYYSGGNSSNGTSSNSSGMSGNGVSTYTEMIRDPRQGRAPLRRRMYMEGKEKHQDTNYQLRQLEAYLKELSEDITQMVKDASSEEKKTLKQKMATLADKIA